ncbi:hypothetical protein PCASD_08335 [Puccinia coronata f. sp. avenae]|uniref:C3H1-type domain-containing protein n=1 Tax=Puccinia coronata f. sp. avenae TaxID=200324 RepID=A0A2N5USE0_9BASI|nr:hypothetical protein PCASD_08335 [Puccinia coronata f. sp. avenae]
MSTTSHPNPPQKTSHINDKLITPLKQQAVTRTTRQTNAKLLIDQKTPPNTRSGHPPAIGATGNTPTISTANGNHPSTLDSSKKSASKVSHVICKFFKAGNCSAGTTCQFSHTLPELGQGKPVCQWFVKGNCRFAHKCALAHILPGQPMSMDRKNKRAAQAAAREAAANSATQPSDTPFPASPPPELTLELVDDDNHPSNSSSNHLTTADPTQSIDALSSPEVMHRSRQLLRSPRALLSDLDHETSNQSDDLQFGLPDDFVTSENSPPVRFGAAALSPSGRHSNGLFPNPLSASFPDQQYQSHHHLHENRYSPLSITPHQNGFSSERHQTFAERARAWPREQSPSPFGAGSPFSAPGSRSVFLPRIGSFGSDDGYPRSAPSVATSPNHVPHSASTNHPNEEDLWDEVEVDGEEDVTELLPSSLHSLLTPAERHRQHIRKHAPHTLFSRSVPVEDIISTKLKKHTEPSALRNGMAINNPLSVSPAPGSRHVAPSNPNEPTQPPYRLSYQRETSNTTIRSQHPNYLSSSYIPPASSFGNWEQAQPHDQAAPTSSQLSPPIALPLQKSLDKSSVFGHAPGTSLPQGLAAGLSRLHFQPPLPTGLTPYGSPSGNPRDHPLSPPRSPPLAGHNKYTSSTQPLSLRMAGLNLGSTTVTHSSPLSRNVSCSPGPLSSLQCPEDDDAPFRLEM